MKFDRINNFNLIRLIAALQVLFVHSFEHLKLANNEFLHYFFKNFIDYFPGVPIFFTVSGFLIFASFDKNNNNLKKYFFNRFVRLFPALWVCLLVTIVLLLLAYTGETKDILFSNVFYLWVLEQLTFFQFHTPDLLRFWGVGTPNGSLWTIAVEVQFYFLIPVLYYLFLKGGKFKMIIISIVFSISIVCNWYFGKFDTESIQYKLAGVWILPYLYCFMFGVIAYLKWECIKKCFIGKFIVWLIIYIVYITLFGNFLEIDLTSYFVSSPFHIITNILLSGLTLSAAFTYKQFSNSLIKENDISYGIYIYHMLVINYFVQNKYMGDSRLLVIVCFIVVIVAFISWKFIEQPVLNLKQKKLVA